MAIIGLTDKATLKPRLPRIGKLRKGGEKSNKKPGADLSHFRFTTDNAEIAAAFEAAYGKTPQLVNIVLFHETLEENFETWIEAWDASGLVFRSDGEFWHVWREGSAYKRGLKPHQDADGQTIVGRLEFIIPELLQQGFVGTVTLETHSNHDLRNIAAVLAAAERERNGLRGAAFVLRRVEEEITVPGYGKREGQRSKATKWLVKLEAPRRVFDGLLLENKNETPRIETDERAALPEPTAGKWSPRPWQPEELRRAIEAQAAKLGNGAPASDKQKTAARLAVMSLVLNDDTQYRQILQYLTGVTSSSDLTKGYASALIKWSGTADDPDRQPKPEAIAEAAAVVKAVNIANGQELLFDEPAYDSDTDAARL